MRSWTGYQNDAFKVEESVAERLKHGFKTTLGWAVLRITGEKQIQWATTF